MTAPTFYDVVVIHRTEATERLGIGDKRGVVVGIAEPEAEGETRGFAVAIGAETYMVQDGDLSLTGERVEREAVYDGSSLHVTVEGEPADDGPYGEDDGAS
ncbi:MAG: hypothetical protein ACRD03_05025 [Acidimicrobiales bacterium]